jgi:alpha-1,3-rhamnosyl/mannosyltransferase
MTAATQQDLTTEARPREADELRGARIGFDLRRMHSSGIGRYARMLFETLRREAPMLEWVTVVQSERDAEWVAARAPRATIVVAPAGQYTAREMLRLPALPRRIDLWHSPHPFQLDLGRRAPRLVLTLHDLIPVTHPPNDRARRLRLAFREFVRLSCRRAHAMVANSQFTADEFGRRLGVPTERIIVTPLAADARFAQPADPARVRTFRAARELPRSFALYVGMSEPHKNLRALFEAMALLKRVHTPADLGVAIIGPTTGPYAQQQRATLERHIGELGVGHYVHFLGTLSDDELQLAYRAADVLVHPSRIEGFGLTIVEAMLAGTPVVASDIPVFREVAGEAAELFDPSSPESLAAALGRVLFDPARAAALRAAGQVRAKAFSWSRTAGRTLVAYRRVLG